MLKNWRIVTGLWATTLLVACSGPQTTEITPKGGGHGSPTTPDFPNKPSKSKHDSLGQLALVAADFVEVEAILKSFLHEDLNKNSPPQACPRRRLEGKNEDLTKWYFSLNWNRCGKSYIKSGVDCAVVTTKTPGELTRNSLLQVKINPVIDPVPVRDCAKHRHYISESVTVFSDSGLIIKKFSKNEHSSRFSFERDQLLIYQREKVGLKLKQTIKFQGHVLVPVSDQEKLQFLIDNSSPIEAELVESQAKSSFYDNVIALAPDTWTSTQQCGFLQGQFSATITSDKFTDPIENQVVRMDDNSISSPMTETVISWPACKRGAKSPNAQVITDFFRKFKAGN